MSVSSFDSGFHTLSPRRARGPGLLASRTFWIGGLVSALVWAGVGVLLAWLLA